jgi:hypothetical protein
MKYREARKVQRAVAEALSKLLGGSEVYRCGCCDTLRVDVDKRVYAIEIGSVDDFKIHEVLVHRDYGQEEGRGARRKAARPAEGHELALNDPAIPNNRELLRLPHPTMEQFNK